jgi:hypothetical protein
MFKKYRIARDRLSECEFDRLLKEAEKIKSPKLKYMNEERNCSSFFRA